MTANPHTRAEITRLTTLLAHIPVAMLTTHDGEGVLKSRPMWLLEIDSAGCLWFFTGLDTGKLDFLEHMNLSFSDPGRATYVSISGRGQINTDLATRQRLWTPLAKPWFPEGPDSPNLSLLQFIPHAAEYWNSPHCKLVRLLAVAGAAVGCKPKSMGEHRVLDNLDGTS